MASTLHVSGVGERKADGGRSPVFALAVPRDAFPFEACSLEVLLLLGTFIDSNRLVLHEPFNILVDERVQALLSRYRKVDRSHLVWRLASDALIGYLGFPGVGDIQPNRWVVLGDVQRFRGLPCGTRQRRRLSLFVGTVHSDSTGAFV